MPRARVPFLLAALPLVATFVPQPLAAQQVADYTDMDELNDLLDNQAKAHLLGGVLNLEWQGDENPVMMTGEATMVFEGEISDE